MRSAREALKAAADRLATVSDSPRLDAELLLAHALGITRERLLLERLGEAAPAAFDDLVERRLAHEPVAYLIGRRAFWTIELEVGPGVLIPRPDSETLIEAAIDHCSAAPPRRILDLGTGPGTLLLAALDHWPSATGVGVDRSKKALAIAERNAERLGLAGRAAFRFGNWAQGLDERFDLILCNPPYVETGSTLARDLVDWEPHEALFAGADGLEEYRRLAPQFPRILAAGGVAVIEIGAGQRRAVTDLLQSEGLAVSIRQDLAGTVRCLVARC